MRAMTAGFSPYCPDPGALALFYAQLLGLQPNPPFPVGDDDVCPADIYAGPVGHVFCVCLVEVRSRFWRPEMSLGSY